MAREVSADRQKIAGKARNPAASERGWSADAVVVWADANGTTASVVLGDANGTTCSLAAVVWADAAVGGCPYGWSRICRADSAEGEVPHGGCIERGLWQ